MFLVCNLIQNTENNYHIQISAQVSCSYFQVTSVCIKDRLDVVIETTRSYGHSFIYALTAAFSNFLHIDMPYLSTLSLLRDNCDVLVPINFLSLVSISSVNVNFWF